MITATCLLAGVARADTVLVYSNSVNALVPDGNPVGLVSGTNISYAGPETGIVSVQVALNITGGFNGDLYAYLLGPNGGFAVLLNRSGLTAANPFGYGDAGFNITLADGNADIHNYQTFSYSITGGQLIGTWAPDGRNINPQSTGTQFDAASTAAGLGTFVGANLNGQWTLFLADLAGGGGNSTLVSWGLTIAVPEPQTWVLLVSGGAMLLALRRRR
jgi:subtilisin-like proprotein convertase family protein